MPCWKCFEVPQTVIPKDTASSWPCSTPSTMVPPRSSGKKKHVSYAEAGSTSSRLSCSLSWERAVAAESDWAAALYSSAGSQLRCGDGLLEGPSAVQPPGLSGH